MGHSRDVLAKRYATQQRVLLISKIALALAFLLALTWSGVWLHLRQAVALSYPASVAVLFTILLAAYGALSFPLSYYRGQMLPARLGLSRQDIGSWLRGKAREALLEWIIGTAAAVVIYLLLSVAPAWWWLAVAVITALVSALLTFVGPWVIFAAFFKMEPLPVGELQQRLGALAAKAGFQSTGIYSIDWSRRGNGANAMFLGMGRSRRVLLADTMIKNYMPDEIEAILAHELGHCRKRHVMKLLLFQSGLILVALLLAHIVLTSLAAAGRLPSLADLAGLPLLVLFIATFALALSPALLAFNRRLETQSDAYGLELTGNPDSLVRALSRLHSENLMETDPGRVAEWLFYDHPPLARRLALARGFQRLHPPVQSIGNS